MKGIWQWGSVYSDVIRPKYQASFQSSWTPLERAPKEIEKLVDCPLFLKREDMSYSGSFKFRSLEYQIALVRQNGHTEIIIPTSGNAGIAGAMIADKLKMKAHVFISPFIDREKLAVLKKFHPILYISKDSLRQANILSTRLHIPNLRSSKNDSAIEGYKSLALELMGQKNNISAIFTYVTSGSSIIGMGRAYQKMGKKAPQLHAAQSGSICSVAEEFEKVEAQEQKAGRGGVKNTRRKDEILAILKKTNGRGWYVDNNEIMAMKNLLHQYKIHSSLEGCASLAAAVRASKEKKYSNIAVIISGRDWSVTS